MVLLVLFALLAGAGTALSPCVIPVLPAVLSAGVTGGQRRPLGVALGLGLSFTFATVALVYVIDALGLPNDLTRDIAIVTLLVFGVLLCVQPLADRLEAWISRVVPKPARPGGDGFGSGLMLGASLGLVYAPCAGPILAGVITVSAAQYVHRRQACRCAGLLARLVDRPLPPHVRRTPHHGRLGALRGRIQVAMGVVMIAVAAVMIANLDVRFEGAIARHLPQALVDPTSRIESSSAISSDIAGLRGGGPASHEMGTAQAAAGERLPVYFDAPNFVGTQEWFNTPDGGSLSIGGLRGHVVLVDFWTYTCINCIRTLPYLEAWYRKYHRDGLEVVGVHTPEFPFEREAANVQRAIGDFGITYPVVQDNESATWDAYHNQYWPADYLIDARGRVRLVHFGEGAYAETEAAIRGLLAEAGNEHLGPRAQLGHSARTRTPRRRATSARREPSGSPTGRSSRGHRNSKRFPPLRSRTISSPTAVRGRSGRIRRPPDPARASSSTSRRAASSWSSAHPESRAPYGCFSTASRSRTPSRGRTSTAVSPRSRTSAFTGWWTCHTRAGTS